MSYHGVVIEIKMLTLFFCFPIDSSPFSFSFFLNKGKSVSVLESMTTAFHDIPIDVKKGSSRMMNEASTNLLHGMGNVLDTYSFSAEALVNEEDLPFRKNDTEKGKVTETAFFFCEMRFHVCLYCHYQGYI
jgi:hypothetical protein